MEPKVEQRHQDSHCGPVRPGREEAGWPVRVLPPQSPYRVSAPKEGRCSLLEEAGKAPLLRVSSSLSRHQYCEVSGKQPTTQ